MGLPHLGKYVPGWAYDNVRDLLSGKISTFKSLRDEAGVDVDDIFTNEFLDDIFFPDATREEPLQEVAESTEFGNSGSKLWGKTINVFLCLLLLVASQM